MRSRVVFPEPDGPTRARKQPFGAAKVTPLSAGKRPKRFATDSTTSDMKRSLMLMHRCDFVCVVPFKDCLNDKGDECEHGKKRCHSESGNKLIVVVKNLDLKWHGVCETANVSAHNRNGTELAHCARIAQQHAV